MTSMTSFNSYRRVALCGGIVVFILALGLAHPLTGSRLTGAPSVSAARLSAALTASASWAVTGNLNTARIGHTATLLLNGKVLVAGGHNDTNLGSPVLNSAELYDPATGTWTPTGNLNLERYFHTATLLPNGQVLVAGGSASGFSAQRRSAELYNPATGTWTQTGDLNGKRDTHTATLLPNGKVLVVGGYDGGTFLKSAELYDPDAGTWTAAGNLETERVGHTATLLPTGKVLIAGGEDNNDNQLNSVELYDPSTGAWIRDHRGSLNTAREGHTATLLPTGKVLVVGGFNGSNILNSSELYDPLTGVWTFTGPLNEARYGHPATLLPNGQVLVAGESGSASAELYDPATGAWTSTADPNTRRGGHTATLLPDGHVLVAGGTNGSALVLTAELYDYAMGGWAFTGSLSAVRANHTATLLLSGKVLVAGGFKCCPGSTLSNAVLYDQTTGVWSNTGVLNSVRRNHTATLLSTGQVLVAGGFGFTSALASSELYDPATGVWSPTSNTLTSARAEHTAVLLNTGKVLVAGGVQGSTTLNSAELYDPATRQWTPSGTLHDARSDYTATLLPNGKVLVAGGRVGDTYLNTAELYNPSTGAWALTGNLNAARSHHTATLLPTGKVLVAGGFVGSGNSRLKSAELYDPASGSWSNVGQLTQSRADHTATLLQSGQVLVAGGQDASGYLTSAELYDPGKGAWKITTGLNTERASHTAALLPNGKVLATAGQTSDLGYTGSAELYDVGLGFDDPRWRPALTRVTSPVAPGGPLVATGSFFTGIGENTPVLQLRRLDNEQTITLATGSGGWSNTAFNATLPGPLNFNSGPASATLITNGIPSFSRLTVMQPVAVTPTSQSFDAGEGVGSFRLIVPLTFVSWNATANDPWLHLTSSSSGNGSATMSYSVDGQTANTPRSGTITVTSQSFATQTFTVLQGAHFNDVVDDGSVFSRAIGQLSARGITGGCGNNNYCPGTAVTRAQMAVFIERAMRGGSFVPPSPTCTNGHSPSFTDVACPNFPFADFIEQFVSDGITSGCGQGVYCPDQTVTRWQMAVFIERALGNFTPPLALKQTFGDVPASVFYHPFVEDLVARGITGGCTAGTPPSYCPDAVVTRGQMAVFLVRAFGL